jgi:hypothetical protein
MLGPILRKVFGLLVLLAAPSRASRLPRRSTFRTSAPLVIAPPEPSPKFSTLMTRSDVYSSVIRSLPLVIAELLPIVPSSSKGFAAAAIGMALSFTLDPPSSKLDW